MRLEIILDMDNEAFEEPGRFSEVSRVIKQAVESLHFQWGYTVKLRDSNGNTCGIAKIAEG